MSKESYIPTIGLEIHAELKTQTKMFCDSKNDPDESKPNVNTCPVCTGHPGTLPVINKQAVKHVLRVGVAVGGKLADFTEFDRKNYFYPDIPKGYQISQYKYPLVSGGNIAGVELTRVHLEEDTATSSHDKGDYSLVDFNRAGVPLMELVTEPVIHDAKTAGDFARELQLLLRFLGVSDANMEKGEMRVEANISISSDKNKFGTKVEVKNLNSFRAVERAINYEIARHTELLEAGEKVAQETRGWNETKQETYSQRSKEDAQDYRYFPDPDLPKLAISEIPEFSVESLKMSLPELPWEKRKRYEKDFGITRESAFLFIENPKLADFLESVISILKDKSIVALAQNYITTDLLGLAKDIGNVNDAVSLLKFSAEEFSSLIGMITDKKVSSRGAKDVLAIMYREGGSPLLIAEKNGLMQKSDEGELKVIVKTILDANEKVVADYKSGKESALQYLIGQGMKVTKGSANPEVLKGLIKSLLS
ncbi:MAG: Asp-tRNA(Asn)/Glu-tRNA(Gln) amidotransferase subunit GatB [Candidatus Taylorbacteria bacterium]|nr:Asp-tRNA(Asn)/Glu-tRNA(Gln) amidotransferase subunit GatB [Candidatus Taylorbacteria bacterium]